MWSGTGAVGGACCSIVEQLLQVPWVFWSARNGAGSASCQVLCSVLSPAHGCSACSHRCLLYFGTQSCFGLGLSDAFIGPRAVIMGGCGLNKSACACMANFFCRCLQEFVVSVTGRLARLMDSIGHRDQSDHPLSHSSVNVPVVKICR